MSDLFGAPDCSDWDESDSNDSDSIVPDDHDGDDEVVNVNSTEGTEGNSNIDMQIVVDGEEPLDCAVMEQIMPNLGSIGELRLSCGIHSLQLVVTDGLNCAKFMTKILSKTSRFVTLIHTSGNFRDKFLTVFRKTIPSSNNTRWNSIYIQLKAVSKLDFTKLQSLLSDEKHDVCMLTKREISTLLEVVSVLEHAYTATLIMEEDAALESLIGPTVTSLHKKWSSAAANAVYCQSLARALFDSLQTRFYGLLENLKRKNGVNENAYGTGPFSNLVYVVSPSMDPDFRFEWLNDCVTYCMYAYFTCTIRPICLSCMYASY